MSQTSKTLRRLCLATGAVTVAGVLPVLAAIPAFAATSVTNTTLAVNPATASASTTSTQTSSTTTTFTATNAVATSGTITIDAFPSTGQTFLSQTPADYTVTDATNNTVTGSTAVPSGNSVIITITGTIAAGDTVSVTDKATTNPVGTGSSVYLTDATGTDTAAAKTPSVTFAAPSIATAAPAVTQVNPNTLPANTANVPFTITGTNLGTVGGVEPTVTFTPVTGTTTTGAVPVTASMNKSGTSTGTQYSGLVSNLVGGVTYDVIAGNSYGTSSISTADQAQAVTGLAFVPESGVRVVDSRQGAGNMNIAANPIPAGNTETVSLSAIENAANIPAGATAIAMNVTAIGESAPGNFQVFNGTGAPGTSTVNFTPGVDTGNFTILPIALTSGAPTSNVVSIYNAKGGSSADVTFDVVGYYGGAGFTSVQSRLLDTRPSSNTGGLLGPLPGRQEFSVSVPKSVASPGDTIALNVTDVAPTAVGNLRVFPDTTPNNPGTTPVPNTAVTNYVPGVDSGSFLVTQVGSDGKIDLYSDSSGTVNVVLDVAGDLGASLGAPGSVNSITPYRAFDSRTSGGIASGVTRSVQINGTGTPSDFTPGNAVAAIVSVSAINPASAGNLRAFPDGGAVPNTATINYYPNNTRENLAIVALKNGKLDLHSDGAFVNSTVDVVGYVLGS